MKFWYKSIDRIKTEAKQNTRYCSSFSCPSAMHFRHAIAGLLLTAFSHIPTGLSLSVPRSTPDCSAWAGYLKLTSGEVSQWLDNARSTVIDQSGYFGVRPSFDHSVAGLQYWPCNNTITCIVRYPCLSCRSLRCSEHD